MKDYGNDTKEELIIELNKLNKLHNTLLHLYDKEIDQNKKVKDELLIANKALAFQNEEKEKRSSELISANKDLVFQNQEKEKRSSELVIANKEFAYQNHEKEIRSTELINANKELDYLNEEKHKRAIELIIANKVLAIQDEEKAKRILVEDSLRETNEYLENLFSYANAPIIVWDMNYNITRFNPAFEILTGRKARDLIGQPIKILFDDDSVESSMKLLRQAQKGKRLEVAEIKIQDVNGSIKTVLWNSAPVLGADRETIIEIIAQGQDITDRKLAEDSLRETNEYLENLFSYANAPIIVWDTNYNITRFNPAFEILTGRKAREVIGQPIKILFDDDSVESSMKLLRQAQKGKRLVIAEIKIQHVNGSIKTVLWNSAPVLGADRETIIEIIAQGQDITDRKLAEDSLRETNEYLENLFSYANAPIIVWDTNYNITRFNPAFEILTGRNACEVIGHSINILFPEDSLDSSMKLLKQAQKGERLEIEEIKIIHSNGTVRTVIWNSAPVYGSDGKTITEIIAQGQDITDRKMAEEELDVYRKHLEELVTKRTADLAKAVSNLEHSNKELEEFAYVASHDLQEPLRMISSYTQLLERRYKDKLDQDANDFIQYAVDGANRMQKLINDLLDYSRVSSQGKVFLRVDISQALGQAVSNLQSLISDNLAMVTNEDLPVLNIDETQIVRVFQNLIENAIKYKKKTELPKIHISCKKKNNLYEFAVSDNGMGIDMQYHDRIFIIFQRLHRKDEYPGTGIGLSVTKRIIERHGGSIWFESKKDEGTTFFFTIPE